jgi:hypothetical protein
MGNKINTAGAVVTIFIHLVSAAVSVYLVSAYFFKLSQTTSLILTAALIMANIGLLIFLLRKQKRFGAKLH